MTASDNARDQDQVPATYLPKGEGPGYPPDRTAVLIIDPVNDFLSEGGAAWEMTKFTVEHNDVVKHKSAALACRGSRKAKRSLSS